MNTDVIISNGHSKFILATAAVEAAKHAVLDAYITAGYPTAGVKRAILGLGLERMPSVARLLAREEALPRRVVHPLWSPEIVGQIAAVLSRSTVTKPISAYLEDFALKLYGYEAARIVSRSRAAIYHYRSGYGHRSVRVAKRKRMVALCDHSIVHPAVLEHLIDHHGRLPSVGQSGRVTGFWRGVLDDIDQADHVLVNSDFVKQTFLSQGWEPERIRVAYTGIDQQFLDAVPDRRYSFDPTSRQRLMFAGEFGPRKGAGLLVEALMRLRDLPWQLEIIGTIDPATRTSFVSFLESERVTLTGFVPRLALAQRLSQADIFVFPSLAEGSARVIFMAMACGCYVITTPNSGSVVADGINGALVPPGDADALEAAIRRALLARSVLEPIGRFNATLIRTKYRQADYGRSLMDIYTELGSVVQ